MKGFVNCCLGLFLAVFLAGCGSGIRTSTMIESMGDTVGDSFSYMEYLTLGKKVYFRGQSNGLYSCLKNNNKTFSCEMSKIGKSDNPRNCEKILIFGMPSEFPSQVNGICNRQAHQYKIFNEYGNYKNSFK
ncbi:MAG: hypothetical protein ABFQ53_02740 [Patescibacteria group bacterium]